MTCAIDMFCTHCPINRTGCKAPVGHSGPLDAKVLIVGEAPGPEDVFEGEIFKGQSGELTRATLKKIGAPTARFYNAVLCRPTERGFNRSPTDREIELCSENLREHIRETRPEIVVCLGGNALKSLVPSYDGTVGDSRFKKFDFEGVQVRATWSPSYVVRSGGENSPQYQQFSGDLRRFLTSNRKRDFDFRIYQQYEVDEFIERYSKSDRVALDYESNFHHPLAASYRMAGLGLSDDEGAGYLLVSDFWNHRSDLLPHTRSRVRQYLKDSNRVGRQFVVFNCRYELSVTFSQFGVELENFEDVMQVCRTINIGGGLKEISQNLLGAEQWTGDLDTWNSSWDALWSALKPTYRKTGTVSKKEILVLEEQGVEGLIAYLTSGARNSREEKIYSSLLKCLSTLHSLRGCNDETHEIFRDVLLDKVESQDWQSDYRHIPVEINGYYCGTDCANTLLVRDEVYQVLDRRNLKKAAEYYNEQGYLAYTMDLHGSRWNEDLAQELDETYERLAIDALRNILLSEKGREALKLSDQDILNIQAATDVDTLKDKYYNPGSNTSEAHAIFEALVVDNQLKFAMALNEANQEVLSNEDNKIVYPYFFSLVNELAATDLRDADGKPCKDPRTGAVLRDPEARSEILRRARGSLRSYADSGKLTNSKFGSGKWAKQVGEIPLLVKYTNYKITSTSSSVIEAIYEAFTTIMGIDPDRESTWTPEFRMLYYFRLHKKVLKSKSTYINGKVGRGIVYVVDKEQMATQDYAPRLRDYWSRGTLQPSETYLFQSDYFPNSAATKRWRAGVHTVPWGSELKDLVLSRFPNGILIHMDGSQMEVRVLAAIAEEETLLEAFRQGKDVHRMVAAKVWKKEEKDVTSAERRFAKMATFSLLYGKTVEGFAQEFMGGDLTAATALFDDFFAAFPKVKKYIDESHEMLMATGEVSTMWGDPIVIPFDPTSKGSVNSAKRQAQNYRIQSTASNVMGVTLSRIARMRKRLDYLYRIFGFTHDSTDIDVPVTEALQVIKELPRLGEQLPRQEWNLPVECDIEIGVSGNQMMVIEPIDDKELVRQEGNALILECLFGGGEEDGGSPLACLEIKRMFEEMGAEVEIEITKTAKKYTSLKELFITRRAYSLDIGREKEVVWGSMKIKVPL